MCEFMQSVPYLCPFLDILFESIDVVADDFFVALREFFCLCSQNSTLTFHLFDEVPDFVFYIDQPLSNHAAELSVVLCYECFRRNHALVLFDGFHFIVFVGFKSWIAFGVVEYCILYYQPLYIM